jgi:branched-chain amino acid transport system permease protein
MISRALGRDLIIAGSALAALVVLPTIFPSKALFDFLLRFAAYALFATSLNLLVGYSGMVSFGHAMFFGIGAYSFVLLMQRTQIPIPIAFILTIGVAAVTAFVMGLICVRLKEIYFAFLTLAFQMLLYSLILLWVPLTGGDQGLSGGFPRPPFLGVELSNPRHLYLTVSTVLVVGLLLMRHIVESPFGYTLRAIRDNPVRAAFLGIDVERMKLVAFVLAGIFASIGGVILALFVVGAYPDFAYWTTSGDGIFMIMVGGITTFLGPTVGAAFLLLLNDVVTRLTDYYGLVLGPIIVLFALGLRRGVTDVLVEVWPFRERLAKPIKDGVKGDPLAQP